MHFGRARVADHANDLAAGGAAHDRIVDQNHALAFKQAVNGIELQLHAEVAHRLLRLDERPSNVVVANQSKTKRNATFGRVADGGRVPGIGHGNHDIRVDRSLTGKLAAHVVAALIHGAAEDHAVRTRKINVLEDAARKRGRRRVEARADAFGPDDDEFAGLYVALVDRRRSNRKRKFPKQRRSYLSSRRSEPECGPWRAAESRADRGRRRCGRG